MKKLVLLSLLFASTVQAQITVNSDSFPVVGDTIRVSMAVIENQDYTLSGPGLNWDFSTLVPDSQYVTDYRPVSETNIFLVQPYFGSFADAAHQASYYTLMNGFALAPDSALGGISIDKVCQFSKLTTTALTNVGFSAEITGFPVAVPSDTIETVYAFPMNYLDSWSTRGYSAIDLAAINLAFKQMRQRESAIDGWGSITTPYGTFDVLRVKHIINEIDSIMIEIDTLIGPQWFGFPLPERHDYEWIAANDKEPILRITTTVLAGFETISSIVYRDIKRDILQAGINEMKHADFGIYPNPTQKQLQIKSSSDIFAYQIINLEGRLLRSGKINGKEITLDIESLPSGSYEIRIVGQNGLQSKSFYKL